MYAVGVGNAVEDELKEIASEPTGEHYFYTADFKAMTQIAKKLQINVCPGLHSPSFLPTIGFVAGGGLTFDLSFSAPADEDPCECDSLVKFQKKVEEALQALTKKHILKKTKCHQIYCEIAFHYDVASCFSCCFL